MIESLPMPVKVRPYAHQQEAFDFACGLYGLIPSTMRSPGCAILAEMGCGKTLIAIGIIGILYQFGLVQRVLIVAPLSILGVWEEELQRFAAYPYHVVLLKGTAEKKKSLLKSAARSDLEIIVVNYESAWRMEKEIAAFAPDLLVCDEAHKLKDNRSRQSKGIQNIAANTRFRLILTGTIISGKELDVFSPYKVLNPRIFGTSFYSFRNRYFDMTGYGGYVPQFRESMTDDFLRRLHSIAFRITKEECLDLPEITEEVRTVELEPKARTLYDKIQKESMAELVEGEVTAVNILTKILRLSQMTGGFLTDDAHVTRQISTAKLEALKDIVEAAVNDGEKVVIMARFVSEMDEIEAMLVKMKVGFAVVRGGIRNRQDEIGRFQKDPSCMVFVGQIAAAGLGITLTAAHIMVFYSLDYSMSNFEQAKARIHRVSQKENCHYIYLCCTETVDYKILRSLRDKMDLAKTLVDDYRKGNNPFR